MKKIIQLFVMYLSILLVGCNNQLTDVVSLDSLTEEESSLGFAVTLGDVGSLDESLSLPAGSKILINASGALNAINQEYNWNGTSWVGEDKLIWDANEERASLLALYPFYSNYLYTSNELYSDEMLVDLLYDYKDIYDKKAINLAFKHRFSLLSISSSPEVKRQLKSVKLTIPCKVSSLSVTSAEVEYDFTSEQVVALSANEQGEYLFIIPPVDNLELRLTLVWNDKQTTHVLDPVSFKSNHRYNYHLKSTTEHVGIRTVDDFIAFGRLINGESYSGEKTLEDFGTTQDGVTTYYLLNDLYFEPEDSVLLTSIGRYSGFEDVFEGNNYTLSGLRLKSLADCYGLFNEIGSKGVIRNLHIKESQIYTSSRSYSTAFIASYNFGLIDHCSVTNCRISLPDASQAGMIVSSSYGLVLNCWSWNCNLDLGSNSAIGGIIGHSEGKTFNCYAGNHTFAISNTTLLGGICSKIALSGSIWNCYYYNSQSSVRNLGGVLNSSIAKTGVVSNCYTNSTLIIKNNEGNISMAGNFKYASNFPYTIVDQEYNVFTALNNWIETIGPNLTKHSLKKWKQGENGVPACFVD
ncbi:MAG: fimbrillin family protein [Phocaeicola sp.]